MKSRPSTRATAYVAVGLLVLALMMILRDNDAEPGRWNAESHSSKSSWVPVPGPRLPIAGPRVRQIYRRLGFVTLDSIHNLGLEERSELEVVRDGIVVARLRVTAVEGGVAAADILPGFANNGEGVRIGDEVVRSPSVSDKPDADAREVDRIAKGTIARNGINAIWGFVRIEHLQGSPRRGDEAYLQRLGPAGGLMTIESVEGNKAIFNLGTVAMQDLSPGDRIETRPPSIAPPRP